MLLARAVGDSGKELSADTVITMSAWFARHEVDKQGKGFSPGEEGIPATEDLQAA